MSHVQEILSYNEHTYIYIRYVYDIRWRMVFTVAIWHIWRARNRAVFDHKMIKAFSVFNAFYVDYMDTKMLLQGKGAGNFLQRSPAWRPPAPGALKLNIDGSWQAKDVAGGGGVFRSDTGN